MNYRLMFIINAVVLAIFGVLLMALPEFVLTQFEAETYVSTLYAVRFIGGALLMGGLLLWFLQDISAKKQKVVAFLLLAGSVGGFVMGLLGMTSIGVLRANGWIPLVVFGIFALIYAYMVFLQPKPTVAKPHKPKAVPSVNSGQPE